MLPLTALYAAPLTLLLIALAVLTIRARRSSRIPLGTEGDAALLRAARAHANCAEYAPLGLLLLALAEANGAGALVHAAGAPLLLGRALHALGVSRAPEDFRLRVAGMALTFASLGVAALLALAGGLSG
jgi:uncharacterized membrane protein YecN with MAPEG domain